MESSHKIYVRWLCLIYLNILLRWKLCLTGEHFLYPIIVILWPVLIGHANWKALELPESTQVVNLKQYWITCGQKGIITLINDMLEVGVIVPTNYPM